MTRSTSGRLAVALMAGTYALFAVACVPPPIQPETTTTTTPKARGATLYADCSGCHGEKGEKLSSSGGLSTMSFTKFKEGLAKSAMNGVPGIDATRKSDDDTAALLAYLVSRN